MGMEIDTSTAATTHTCPHCGADPQATADATERYTELLACLAAARTS